jgi:hypothetical protein
VPWAAFKKVATVFLQCSVPATDDGICEDATISTKKFPNGLRISQASRGKTILWYEVDSRSRRRIPRIYPATTLSADDFELLEDILGSDVGRKRFKRLRRKSTQMAP